MLTQDQCMLIGMPIVFMDDERTIVDGFKRISYSSETGELTWAIAGRGIKIGRVAGFITSEGYRTIKLNRVAYPAHRLAWFIYYGVWPLGYIDHINGIRSDNRIENLRDGDHSLNMQNKRNAMSNNKSCGFLGVTWNKQHSRWQSKIMVNKKPHHVGYFDAPEDAHQAYLLKKRQLHAGCTI